MMSQTVTKNSRVFVGELGVAVGGPNDQPWMRQPSLVSTSAVRMLLPCSWAVAVRFPTLSTTTGKRVTAVLLEESWTGGLSMWSAREEQWNEIRR